tara:strand:+ start:144 stop:359 length:216 start_codon:yes stop_codon:yes gene_type:complete
MIPHFFMEDPGAVIRHMDVPQEIVKFCDVYTYFAPHDDLRYIDCVYMHMGEYGNDPESLKRLRTRSFPVFE